jgi:hypothetical protein
MLKAQSTSSGYAVCGNTFRNSNRTSCEMVRCSRLARSANVRHSSSVRRERNGSGENLWRIGDFHFSFSVGVRSWSACGEFLAWQVRQHDQAAVRQKVAGVELPVIWEGGPAHAHAFQ